MGQARSPPRYCRRSTRRPSFLLSFTLVFRRVLLRFCFFSPSVCSFVLACVLFLHLSLPLPLPFPLPLLSLFLPLPVPLPLPRLPPLSRLATSRLKSARNPPSVEQRLPGSCPPPLGGRGPSVESWDRNWRPSQGSKKSRRERARRGPSAVNAARATYLASTPRSLPPRMYFTSHEPSAWT